jgi:inosose dehydratase
VLDRYDKRIAHVHIKDIRPPVVAAVRNGRKGFLEGIRLGCFTIPGGGGDFTEVFSRLAALDYMGWLVVKAEQDPAKANPLKYAIKVRRYIGEKTGL